MIEQFKKIWQREASKTETKVRIALLQTLRSQPGKIMLAHEFIQGGVLHELECDPDVVARHNAAVRKLWDSGILYVDFDRVYDVVNAIVNLPISEDKEKQDE